MEESRQRLVHSIEEELKDCVLNYRHIHQHPEIGLEEHHTAAYIRKIIAEVEGAHLDPPLAELPTAIIARVNAGQPDAPTVLLRC
jgi:metal-dependent amidase/aminoacylase/carboxypeptidase family protein